MSRNFSSNVLSLWTTPVTLGSIQEIPNIPHEIVDIISSHQGKMEINLENPNKWESQLISIAFQIINFWNKKSDKINPEKKLVSLSIECWKQGFEIPAYSSTEDIHGWLFLAGTPAKHSDSGTVCILDPRAGSDMCAVPGLPWGRPLILAPSSGSFAIVPGWLTSSVLPLEPGQESLVLRFSANLIPD